MYNNACGGQDFIWVILLIFIILICFGGFGGSNNCCDPCGNRCC